MGSGSEASWIVLVEWLSRLILLLLVGLSVWSVRLIAERWMFFKTLKSGKNLEWFGKKPFNQLLPSQAQKSLLLIAAYSETLRASTIPKLLKKWSVVRY